MQWFKSTMQWFNMAKLAIFKVALLHQCMELKNVFSKKVSISSMVKVPFSKNIHGMTQCLPNPGFRSIKVQNVDFLKKPSVDNIFFLIFLVISNLLWPFSTHLLFFLHTPLLMKVCGKLFFLTEKSITCEENYFSSQLALVQVYLFPKMVETITSFLYKKE